MALVNGNMFANNFGSWLEETFEIYKNAPISHDSFGVVEEKIRNYFDDYKLEQLLDISEDSVGSYCGVSFKRDQLMYHCR